MLDRPHSLYLVSRGGRRLTSPVAPPVITFHVLFSMIFWLRFVCDLERPEAGLEPVKAVSSQVPIHLMAGSPPFAGSVALATAGSSLCSSH